MANTAQDMTGETHVAPRVIFRSHLVHVPAIFMMIAPQASPFAVGTASL